MIQLNKIVISHSLDCFRDLKVVGDRKIETIDINLDFKSESDFINYKKEYCKERNLKRSQVDFYYKSDIEFYFK